ncbi:hypothetical protein BJ875DRAFT_115307 [Amylocarpus encephaloides]|uniref:Telomerase reverse transcriptase n=1 Tax=Amylocarpus encephaloides TaxID=45428 RepID=A0A9P7YEC9_9HELO|nr:hypothetical protein BJ875DRAFT_115307 [Amylocarpus encephaloides]
MGSKRKRKRPNNTVDSNEKRQKISGTRRRRPNPKDSVIKQALLAQFYPQVFTLREYLLSKLPTPSKIRRKKILSVGVCGTSGAIENEELAAYLDRTLVGVSRGGEGIPGDRWRHWNTFSQKADESMSTLINLNAVGRYSQSEIVDFAIWLLFSKNAGAGHGGRVHHLLCQGYQKHASSHMVNRDENFTSAIPGIVSTYPNGHVTSMKTAPWPQILLLVGTEGERAMVDLILDCGVFVEVGDGRGIYHQLCGLPLSELQVLSESERKPPGPPLTVSKNRGVIKVVEHNASSIKFVRSRVMYARAAFNAQGGVRFGLRHIRESLQELQCFELTIKMC